MSIILNAAYDVERDNLVVSEHVHDFKWIREDDHDFGFIDGGDEYFRYSGDPNQVQFVWVSYDRSCEIDCKILKKIIAHFYEKGVADGKKIKAKVKKT